MTMGRFIILRHISWNFHLWYFEWQNQRIFCRTCNLDNANNDNNDYMQTSEVLCLIAYLKYWLSYLFVLIFFGKIVSFI